jgi:hypothetical protein
MLLGCDPTHFNPVRAKSIGKNSGVCFAELND